MSDTKEKEVNQTESLTTLTVEMIQDGKLPERLTMHTAHGGGMSLIVGDEVLRFEGGVHTTTNPEHIEFLANEWIKDRFKFGNPANEEKPITMRYLLTPEERDQYVAKDKNYLYFMGALRPMNQVRLALAHAVEAGFKFDTAAQVVQGNIKANVAQGSLSGGNQK